MKKVIRIVCGVILIILLVVASACNRTKTSECFPGKSLPFQEIETTESKYLPKKFVYEDLKREELEDEKRLDEFYSKMLTVLKEPSLITESTNKEEAYRFLWLRTFDEPISLRILKAESGTTIVIKKSDGKSGYEPGKLVIDTTKSLSAEEWQKFMILLENNCFWGMRSWNDNLGLDGTTWILEGVKNGRHHLVARWSPGGGDFQQACEYLLQLSELNEKDK